MEEEKAIGVRELPDKPPDESTDDIALAPSEEEESFDKGWFAWLQVAGAFALFFNSWGVVNTFGVYQTYYETHLLRTSTPDAISWIGSVQSFLLLGGGLAAGPLFDGGRCKSLVATGTFATSFGFMMTSLATRYWQVLLAQGFCIGLGAGCVVVPSLAILPHYFARKRALVTGITVSGSSVGGVVYPLVFQTLLGRVGFAWTNRVLGFLSLVTCAFALAVLRPRLRPRRVTSPVDPAAFREPPYLFYCGAMFFSNLGFFVPVFYLQTYALTHGLAGPARAGLALHLVAILNAASFLGRLTPSWLVLRLGAVHTMMFVAAAAAAVAFSWTAVDSAGGCVAFAVLYGFFSGGIVSLPAVVLAAITRDLSFLGARLGTANFLNALASLCGAPVGGAILKATGDYLGVQLFAGFALVMTTVCMLGVRIAAGGTRLFIKV